jgi:hypothetical protein
MKRGPTLGAFIVIAVIAFIALFALANSSADSIDKEWTANEALATSAPQQSVSAEWAVKEAELSQLREDGVRNGLLAICAAFLAVIAITTTSAGSKTAASAAVESDPTSVVPPTPPE